MQFSVLTPYCPQQSVMQLSLLIVQNSGAAQTPDTLLSKKSVMQLSVLKLYCPKSR